MLRKDLAVFTLRNRLLVLGAFFLAALQTVGMGEVYFFVGLMLASALAVFVPVVEWFHTTDSLLHSLPVRRSTVVLARYLSTVLAGCAAFVAWVCVGWMLRPILVPEAPGPAMWMSLQGALTFLGAFGLLTAFFLPLYFGVGIGRAALAFFGLMPLLALAGYASAGVAWGPTAGGAVARQAAGAPIVLPSSLISARISSLVATVGPGWALVAIALGMGSILALSGRLALRWFRRREL